MKKILFFILAICTAFLSKAENPIDSLRKIISSNVNDSVKTMAYINLAYKYIGQPAKALEVASEMALFSEKIKNKRHLALCLRKIGVIYHQNQFFDKSLEYNFRSAKLFDELNDKDGMANCYNNIASGYSAKGDLTSDNLILDQAILYHEKAIQIRKEIHDTLNIKNSYNNIAMVYLAKKDFDKAIQYLKIPYDFFIERKTDGHGIDMTSLNLGEAWFGKARAQKKSEYYRKALWYFTERLNSYTDQTPAENHANALMRSGEIYVEIEQLERGLQLLLEAHAMYLTLQNQLGISASSLALSKAYKKRGDYKNASEYLGIHLASKDSVLNQSNKSNADQLHAIYSASQKDKEIEKLNSEKKLKDVDLKRQRTIIISSIVGLILILLLGSVLLSRYNLKKKASKQVELAYKNIELKNRQITDSINYAKRIQTALLPPLNTIELNHFFIYYQPKDIVSGDFYWHSHHGDKTFFIVADCTGHGVPGALMSMIGNTLLNEIINQKNIFDPGSILEHLHKGVSQALRQQGLDQLSQDDGMDVTVCSLDKNQSGILSYATANHCIFIKNQNTVKELKGDIHSIGGNFDNSEKKFKTHTITLENNSFVVLSTDGYYDQFGGNKNGKFLVSRFEKLLAETDLSKKSVSVELKNALEAWRGNNKQTDDILVAGFAV